MRGQIAVVYPDRGYAFIHPHGQRGKLIFLAAGEIDSSISFDARLAGAEITFDIVDDPRGPRAANVILQARTQ